MEVVLALGLVVIMALAIVGIFSRLMSRSAYSADQAAAQLLAQSLLDKAIRMGPPDWGGQQWSFRACQWRPERDNRLQLEDRGSSTSGLRA